MATQGAKPVRKIEGQKTLLGRTMHAISYDEINDEFIVPQQFAQAILTFRGGADGQEPPVRVIQGSKTRLTDPDRLGLNAVANEIYVPQDNILLVYDRRANGDVAPIRVIEGKNTGLGASAVAGDPLNNLIIVSGGGGFGGTDRGGTVFRVFDRMANGDVAPKLMVRGPRALGGPFAIYPKKKLILGTNRPTGEALAGPESYLGIWSYAEGGDHPPIWTVGGPNGIFLMPRGVAIDEKNKSIIASDKRLNSVFTFYFPEMFN